MNIKKRSHEKKLNCAAN